MFVLEMEMQNIEKKNKPAPGILAEVRTVIDDRSDHRRTSKIKKGQQSMAKVWISMKYLKCKTENINHTIIIYNIMHIV